VGPTLLHIDGPTLTMSLGFLWCVCKVGNVGNHVRVDIGETTCA
jgi:hypothetical protein